MKVALTGGAYTAHSVIASAQRCLNLVQEPIPENQGEPMPSAAYPTPGTTLLGTIGTGPIRGIRQCTTGSVYVVSGDTLYSVDVSNWSGFALGTLTPGLKTPVSMQDNGLDMLVVDGTMNGWQVDLIANTMTPIPSSTVQTPYTSAATFSVVAGTARYTPITAASSGAIVSITVEFGAGYTGALKCSVFASAGQGPTDVLGSASVAYNPPTGGTIFTFSRPVSVTKGTGYWIGFDSDTTHGAWSVAGPATGLASTTAYADFPVVSPAVILVPAVVVSLTISNDPGSMFAGADRVDYLDTFFILNKPGTPQFYISGSLAVTFDSLDFANKEAYSDLLVTVVVAKRLLYLFGERTTEIWYDAGATDIGAGSFPFAAMQSEVFIDHGCAARHSPAIYDNSVFWLTKDRQGQGIVMMVAGYQTKRVSTYAIEAEIAGYARIDDAIGFCYQMAGHTYYVLAFPLADRTWSYDITTGFWHEWHWTDSNGTEHRHRSNCFWPVNDTPVVGDWQNGNLYALDNRVFTDNGQTIKRVRSFPHMLNDGKRVFYRQFLADMETGWAPEIISGSDTRLLAQFTASDGTNLSSYVSEVGGGWTALGPANAQIVGDKVVGLGGDALYQSAAAIFTPDLTLHFDAVPPVAGSVVTGNTLWAIGRASGANTGYQVAVSADGTQYTLTLDTLPSGTSASVAMGTIASGYFTVWLLLRGTNITARVQRSIDRMWLRTDGTWHLDPGTIAAQFSDATYAAPGAVMIGGTWPALPPPGPLTATYETGLASDPNFPSGYGYQNSIFGGSYETFDFTNNLYYAAISGSGNGGVAVTDLNIMHVTRTVTMAQMYAGTAYGSPAGTPFSQDIWDLVCGNATDLYMLTSSDNVHPRFTRVNPGTMKVTGDWFVSASIPPPITCVMGAFGAVNKTATHTIVAYRTSNAVGVGPMIFDGTNMAPIGLAATPTHGVSQTRLIPGAMRGDGSCDFIMVNWDGAGGSGNIDIWRITVSDSLTITSTKTGTVNILSLFAPGTSLNIGQASYDTAHDAIILMMTNSGPNGPPVWVVSANWNGTIRWTQGPLADVPMVANNRGQSLLTGTTMMIGTGSALKLLNTATGAITFTGSLSGIDSYIFQVYDASRQSYWTFALATFGFTRIDLPIPAQVLLAMDNVIATATPLQLEVNLISLRWSDDRGHSWGSPVTQDIGEAGEYRTSLQWQRLAYARDRVFEISWSVPMRTALQGCWVDVTPAQS